MAEERIKYQLPKDWKWVKVGEVAKVKGGKRLPKGEQYAEEKTKFPYLRVVDFENMSVNQTDLKYLNENTQKQIKNYTITSNDLYISIAGTIGRVGMIPKMLSGSNLTENAAKITEIKEFDLKYLSLLLNSHIIQSQISQKTIATTQPKLALYRIETLDLPLPPKTTQQAIVSKIEELFSELDKGVEELKTAQQQLKVYRQAVLKWAFEGKLTPGNKTWNKVRLGDVASAIDPQPSHRTPPKFDGGIPFVSTKDFHYETDKISFVRARMVSPKILEEHLARYQLMIGDFVIGKIGTIGKPVRVVLPQDYTLSANIVLIQPRKVNPTYLYYFFQSHFIEKELNAGTRATSQPAFGIQKVRELNIQLPSDKEQQLIVHEIESRISVCDKIEETMTNSLEQVEALRQSILKKAFEGKLV